MRHEPQPGERMSVIVTQLGARHNYAIPRMLHRAGYLEALYTDSCANRGIGRLLDSAVPAFLRPGRLVQLLQRRVVGVPRERIFVTDRSIWSSVMKPWRTPSAPYDHLSAAANRWGVRGASLVYSMFGEGLEFLRAAKMQGARVAVDIFITPVAHRIVRQEQLQFPDWEGPTQLDQVAIEQHVNDVLVLADILTCPGKNVVDGLRCYPAFDESRVRVIPYACGFDYAGSRNAPVPGRVLFAGTAELRKGIHYLAKAANLLRGRGRDYEFRIAGSVNPKVRTHPEAQSLTFLGHLPVSRLKREFMSADLLVLPTLAEGSATVIVEALAAGLPVITTPSAGSILRHGEDGFIVPERDPHALADAIDAVLADRVQRRRLADAAQSNLARYTETEWQERLICGLGLIPPSSRSTGEDSPAGTSQDMFDTGVARRDDDSATNSRWRASNGVAP